MELNDYVRGDFINDIKTVLPDGTEIFIGITLVLDDGVWKQKFSFSKIQNMGKAKTKPKYTPKQVNTMNEQKQLAEEFKNIELVDDEF